MTRVIGPLLLVGIISSAVPATALAFNEPENFRGVPWGTTEELLKGRITVRDCSDYPPEQQMLGERRCSGGWRWDDNLFLEVTYSLRRDRFVSVTLSFKSRDFERIQDWFVGLYGSPSSDRTTTSFKTRDGLEVTNRRGRTRSGSLRCACGRPTTRAARMRRSGSPRSRMRMT